MSYTYLKAVTKFEKDLWNSHVEHMGVDDGMAEMYAADRNDVINAKELFYDDKFVTLASHINHMDTHPREGLVMAFAEDLGEAWVLENLGWRIN